MKETIVALTFSVIECNLWFRIFYWLFPNINTLNQD